MKNRPLILLLALFSTAVALKCYVGNGGYHAESNFTHCLLTFHFDEGNTVQASGAQLAYAHPQYHDGCMGVTVAHEPVIRCLCTTDRCNRPMSLATLLSVSPIKIR